MDYNRVADNISMMLVQFTSINLAEVRSSLSPQNEQGDAAFQELDQLVIQLRQSLAESQHMPNDPRVRAGIFYEMQFNIERQMRLAVRLNLSTWVSQLSSMLTAMLLTFDQGIIRQQ